MIITIESFETAFGKNATHDFDTAQEYYSCAVHGHERPCITGLVTGTQTPRGVEYQLPTATVIVGTDGGVWLERRRTAAVRLG